MVLRLVLATAMLGLACAAAPVRVSARPEGARAAPVSEPDRFVSAKAIAHYLRARLAEGAGDHRGAADELRLALVYDQSSPQLRVALAEVLARLAQHDRAQAEARRALELDPHGLAGARALLLIGKIDAIQHRFGPAMENLRASIRIQLALAPASRDPAEEHTGVDPEPWKLLGELALETGDEAAAARTYEELAALVPGDGSGFRDMGRVFLERRDYSRAEKYLRRAIEVDQSDAEALRKLAELHQARRQFGQAEKDLAAVLRIDSDDLDALLSLGKLAARTGDVQAARAYFEHVLRVSPDEPGARVNVAFTWLEAKRPTEALAVIEEGVRSGAADGRLHLAAGLVLQDQRRWTEAAQAFARVTPADGDVYGSARMNLAYCLTQAGRHAEAARTLESILAARPQEVRLITMLAYVLERGGRVREAITLLEREVKQRERRGQQSAAPELYDALASSLERAGRYRDAVALLRRALDSRPRDEALLYALGAAYEKSGDYEAAIAQMNALLVLDPDHADALNFIGYSYADRGMRLEEAERLIVHALELKPENGFFLDSLGWVYFKKGEYVRAVGALERADRLSGPEPTILEHLGDAYRSAQRPADAEAAYRRALKSFEPAPAPEDAAVRASLEKKLKELSALDVRPVRR